MEEQTLYEQLVEKGIPVDNHCSDLYFKATTESLEILKNYNNRRSTHMFSTAFTSNIDGELWIEVPFAYDPWWIARCGRK